MIVCIYKQVESSIEFFLKNSKTLRFDAAEILIIRNDEAEELALKQYSEKFKSKNFFYYSYK